MQVRLVTPHKKLGKLVQRHLTDAGHDVELVEAEAEVCALRYAEGQPLEALGPLVACVEPLQPKVDVVALEGADAELLLGDDGGFERWDLKIHTPDAQVGKRLKKITRSLGFDDCEVESERVTDPRVEYGGASPFARQVVRFLARLEGVRAREHKRWGEDDNDLWLYLDAPLRDGESPGARHPVVIEGDDYAQVFALKARLEAAGFEAVETRALDPEAPRRFGLAPGPLAHDPALFATLGEVVKGMLFEADVDPMRHPLTPLSEEGPLVRLPLGAHAAGTLASYAGDFPDRWDLVVRADTADAATALSDGLLAAGYPRARTEALPTDALGVTITVGDAAEGASVVDAVRLVVARVIDDLTGRGLVPGVAGARPPGSGGVLIAVPPPAFTGEGLRRRVAAACGNWELTFHCADAKDHGDLIAELRGLNFKEFSVSTEEVDEPHLRYGGAPIGLVAYIAERVRETTGQTLALRKAWDDDDDDLWIYVLRPDAAAAQVETPPVDLRPWLALGDDGERAPFIGEAEGTLRVGHVTLPRRPRLSPLVPPPEAFEHYCLDQRTADTLLHVAESVALREPCLLEGETSVSKTSVIQYLALRLGQPLVRINLNGQTDTGELVGRFVPREEAEDDKHPWRWQDGLIIEAMRHGWWVVLDELNLAEPQILERLNALLERTPSLVLTEYDNSVLGPGGQPIHPEFRIFATMNPAEYAGRSPLSPAYRDRWRGYRYVDAPGEAEYRAMLRFLVLGEQPDVTVFGRTYTGEARPAPFGALATLPDIDAFLAALARFHTALEGAAGQRDGGARGSRLGWRRRERYVFTRRGLLALMDYLGRAMAGDSSVLNMRAALARYYVGRVASDEDRAIIVRLLDAAGIGPETWTLGAPEEN